MSATYNYLSDPSNMYSLKSVEYVNASKHSEEKNWSFPLHAHPNVLEISLIIDGEAEITYNNEKYTVRKGDIVVKNAQVRHSEISSKDSPVEQICLSISGVNLPDMELNTLLPQGLSPVIPAGDAFPYLHQSTFMQVRLMENYPGDVGQRILSQSIATCLSIVEMLIEESATKIKTKEYSELVQEILTYTNEHFRENLSLESISQRFFISKFYLSRKFTKEVGMSLNQYILSLRLGEAQRMLAFEDTPIREISDYCGYSNLQYFYAAFKKSTGMTPADLRAYYQNSLQRLSEATSDDPGKM